MKSRSVCLTVVVLILTSMVGIVRAQSNAALAGDWPVKGSCYIELKPWVPYDYPFIIRVEEQLPEPWEPGGIFVHPLDGDNLFDYVVTSRYSVSAYNHDGDEMWVYPVGVNVTSKYPGYHHPSAIAGDVDGDCVQEVAFLDNAGHLHIVNGVTGDWEKTRDLNHGTYGRPQAIAIADLYGRKDKDAFVQYDQYTVCAMSIYGSTVHWCRDDFISPDHGPLRQADIDFDGKDEAVGVTIIDDNGLPAWDMDDWDREAPEIVAGFVDSLVIADIEPGGFLEAAIAEQGRMHQTYVFTKDNFVFKNHNDWGYNCAGEAYGDPDRGADKLATGDFYTGEGAFELFARSNCGEYPWTIDGLGNNRHWWSVNWTKPDFWSDEGTEEVTGLNWNGIGRYELVVKERIKGTSDDEGAVAIIDPVNGDFLDVFQFFRYSDTTPWGPVNAARVYAADVAGDTREEIIILHRRSDNTGDILVYGFEGPVVPGNSQRPWFQQHYRRQKQNWNYYSP